MVKNRLHILLICYAHYFFSYQPIVDYLDAQFEAYLQEELKIKHSLSTTILVSMCAFTSFHLQDILWSPLT